MSCHHYCRNHQRCMNYRVRVTFFLMIKNSQWYDQLHVTSWTRVYCIWRTNNSIVIISDYIRLLIWLTSAPYLIVGITQIEILIAVFGRLPSVIANVKEETWSVWLDKIRRAYIVPSKFTRVCSDHFVSGKK